MPSPEIDQPGEHTFAELRLDALPAFGGHGAIEAEHADTVPGKEMSPDAVLDGETYPYAMLSGETEAILRR